jgi:hypothetical protein
VLITIDIYDILSRLESNENSVSYIDQAYQIVQRTPYREGFHSILRAYIHIGNYYYMKKQYHIAKKPIESACAILWQGIRRLSLKDDSTYLDEYKETEGKNKASMNEIEEFKSLLSERYNLLGTCLLKSDEYKVCS